jgi:hypothetical protein
MELQCAATSTLIWDDAEGVESDQLFDRDGRLDAFEHAFDAN